MSLSVTLNPAGAGPFDCNVGQRPAGGQFAPGSISARLKQERIAQAKAGQYRDTPVGPALNSTFAVGAGMSRREILNVAAGGVKGLALGVLAGAGIVGTTLLAAAAILPFALVKGMACALSRVRGQTRAPGTGWKPVLEPPRGNSIVGDGKVLCSLLTHASSMGSSLKQQDIVAYVKTGQVLVGALLQDGNGGKERPGEIRVKDSEGNEVFVDSSKETSVAISWYLMAVAASQDGESEAGKPSRHLVTNGGMVMEDKGQRIYRFLKAAGAQPRHSSHMHDCSAAPTFRPLTALFARVPIQFGIEDYQSRFPGRRGALLFDTLVPGGSGSPRLYVKFERAGSPSIFSRDFLDAVPRNLAHIGNYVATRGEVKGSERIERMEHVHKGSLKEPIYRPFMALVAEARAQGLIRCEAGTVQQHVRRYGLPYLKGVVDRLNALAGVDGKAQESRKRAGEGAARLSAGLERMNKALSEVELAPYVGITVDGLTRRGGEVHLDLANRDQARPAASQ